MHEITNFIYENGTTCFITKTGGSFLSRGLANDKIGKGQLEKATTFASRSNDDVVFNASTFNVASQTMRGVVIHEGKVLQDEPNYTERTYLVIYRNGEIGYLEHDTTSKQMLDLGVYESLLGFFPIVIDSKRVTNTYYKPYPFSLNALNPQQIIYRIDSEIYFLTTNGRTPGQPGLSVNQLIELLIKKGADFAYLLDGGGSTTTVENGSIVNKLSSSERPVADFLRLKGSDEEVKTQRVTDIEHIKKTGDYWLPRTSKGLPKNDNFAMHYTALSDEVGILVAYPFGDNDGTVYKNTRRSGKFRGWCKNG